MKNDLKADPAQESAIRQGGGPCAVVAGPGSGKTFVLVEHIRFLIETLHTDPFSILVLTFSRAAAMQMRSRFLKACGQQDVAFGTFHSVFFRILQESSHGKVRLIDAASKAGYLRHLCKGQDAALPSGPFFESERPPAARHRSGLVPDGTTAEELQLLISRFKNGLPCSQPWVPALVREYDLYLRNRGCLDFDDMILRCRDLLKAEPEVLAHWRKRFSWILVDEFQDVSPPQYEVLLLLAAPRNNLFIVGDDDQSIYGFRGADPKTMRRFMTDFHPCLKTVYLTTNYRCGRAILKAGASLIQCNTRRIQKTFTAGSGHPGSFQCRPFTDPAAEHAFIALKLQRMSPEERRDTAVIFRTHALARIFLPALEKRDIPYLAEGTARRKSGDSAMTQILRDLTAYYRAASCLAGSGASRTDLLRIMNRPERYLSGSFLAGERMNRSQILDNAGFCRDALSELTADLELIFGLSPSWSMRYLMDSVGYRAFAVSAYGPSADREIFSRQKRDREPSSVRPVQKRHPGELLDSLVLEAASFETSGKWLDRLLELLEASIRGENETDRQQTASFRGVNILTMHACKGLEFDTVFIPDLNEGNIPAKRAWSAEQIEEERRLLYVAMTRAKRSLTLTYLEGTPDRPAAPSRFLQPLRTPLRPEKL